GHALSSCKPSSGFFWLTPATLYVFPQLSEWSEFKGTKTALICEALRRAATENAARNSKNNKIKERKHEVRHTRKTVHQRITRSLQRRKSIAQGVAEDGKRSFIA